MSPSLKILRVEGGGVEGELPLGLRSPSSQSKRQSKPGQSHLLKHLDERVLDNGTVLKPCHVTINDSAEKPPFILREPQAERRSG